MKMVLNSKCQVQEYATLMIYEFIQFDCVQHKMVISASSGCSYLQLHTDGQADTHTLMHTHTCTQLHTDGQIGTNTHMHAHTSMHTHTLKQLHIDGQTGARAHTHSSSNFT